MLNKLHHVAYRCRDAREISGTHGALNLYTHRSRLLPFDLFLWSEWSPVRNNHPHRRRLRRWRSRTWSG